MSGPAPHESRTGVLFVCLGNICRSPLARMIFSDLVAKAGAAARFDIDSCGTAGYHAGGAADPRTEMIAAKYGLPTAHTSRQVRPAADFVRFDLVIPMDLENQRRLLELGAPGNRVRLMRSYDPALRGKGDHELIVPDPYYGGNDGFEQMYRMLHSACTGLLRECGVEPRL